MQAEIYTKDMCSYCVKAKHLLRELGIPYAEYILSSGFGELAPAPNQRYVTKDMLLERQPNAKTVPQIWINGEYIGGYTELAAAVANGSLPQDPSV